jgi:hypothetical protein
MMPQKPGNLSSHNEARGVGAATLALVQGRGIGGAASGVAVVSATGKLVVNVSGLAAGSVTLAGNLNAILEMVGSSDGSVTIGATISAIAWLSGEATGEATVILQSYAIGYMSGIVYVNEGTASMKQMAEAVWSALSALNNEEGTMGQKLNAAGTAGDPWTANLDDYTDDSQFGAFIKKLLTTAKFLGLK